MKLSVFLGAPGSGKGTQAKRLAETHGFTHLSTGDMLRSEMAAGTAVGKKAKEIIDRGELVPDQIMIEMIERKLSSLPTDAKVILDGFPRTVPQAEALDAKPSTKVSVTVSFKVDEPALVERLTGRRICEKCGEPYHTLFMQSKVDGICDKCGGHLVQRKDDNESVVKRRLEIFNTQNRQLLEYYRNHNNLRELDADRSVETVQSDLMRQLS